MSICTGSVGMVSNVDADTATNKKVSNQFRCFLASLLPVHALFETFGPYNQGKVDSQKTIVAVSNLISS